MWFLLSARTEKMDYIWAKKSSANGIHFKILSYLNFVSDVVVHDYGFSHTKINNLKMSLKQFTYCVQMFILFQY